MEKNTNYTKNIMKFYAIKKFNESTKLILKFDITFNILKNKYDWWSFLQQSISEFKSLKQSTKY